MARGAKTITFDFDFTYAAGGKQDQHNEIHVAAPGVENFQVHATMQGYINRALMFAMPNLASIGEDVREEMSERAKERATEKEGKDDVSTLAIASMGLGPKEYPKFLAYVKKTLTGNSRLAWVGDDKAPISDVVWSTLAEEGGMEAVEQVLAAFADFFSDKGSK